MLHTSVSLTCHRLWGTGPDTPPGCLCASDRRPGFERSPTGPCSRSSPRSRSSTGQGPASTRCRYEPKKGSELTGPNSTDHANPGSKYYLLTDRNGLPLHVHAPAANTHDSRLFELLMVATSGVRDRCGRPVQPRRRPGIKVRVTRRGIEAKTHLDRHGLVVERPISGVLRFKRLGIRYDRIVGTLVLCPARPPAHQRSPTAPGDQVMRSGAPQRACTAPVAGEVPASRFPRAGAVIPAGALGSPVSGVGLPDVTRAGRMGPSSLSLRIDRKSVV